MSHRNTELASAVEPPAVDAALLERTPSPTLVVDLERVRENIRRMVRHAGSPRRWRPHLKTTKTPEIWRELVRAGVREFKCATTRELRLLLELLHTSDVAESDVLLAYPLRGPGLDELARLASAFPGTRVSVLCEDPALIDSISESVSIFVDVNPGMHRTGIPLSDLERILAVAHGAGSRFRGVHYYDGHLHSGSPEERRRATAACYDGLIELCGTLASDGLQVDEIITSGTPTFLHALAYEGFSPDAARPGPTHRISPGTVVLHDGRSEEENPDLDLVPAALLLTRVVSHPMPDVATCDAGSKSIAAEAGDPCAWVAGRPGLVALPPSEEHLPLRVAEGARPALGETLWLFPRHVCPTVNLAEAMLLVDGDEARLVPVAGRAHDTVAPHQAL